MSNHESSGCKLHPLAFSRGKHQVVPALPETPLCPTMLSLSSSNRWYMETLDFANGWSSTLPRLLCKA